MLGIRRREFITLLGGTLAWPLAARAQRLGATIGFLGLGSLEGQAEFVAAFRSGLTESGFVEGRNVTFEFRWAQNDITRLPELAAELVRRRVDIIVVPSATPAALAAKAATATIPIVFHTGADPVQSGLVASLNRPGGNVTGVTNLGPQAVAKRLGLLNEIKPGIGSPIAVLVNPRENYGGRPEIPELQSAAATLGRTIEVFEAGSVREIDAAFERMADKRIEALLVSPSNLFANRPGQIAILSVRHRIATIHIGQAFARLGGLMSYGSDVHENLRQVGLYTGRILNGEKPADLPVMQSVKFVLVINMQTARALGLVVPPTLLAIANEVIE